MLTLIPRRDRRSASRLTVPTCPRCRRDDHVACAMRTPRVIYFHCSACEVLIAETLPVVPLGHGLIAQIAD